MIKWREDLKVRIAKIPKAIVLDVPREPDGFAFFCEAAKQAAALEERAVTIYVTRSTWIELLSWFALQGKLTKKERKIMGVTAKCGESGDEPGDNKHEAVVFMKNKERILYVREHNVDGRFMDVIEATGADCARGMGKGSMTKA